MRVSETVSNNGGGGGPSKAADRSSGALQMDGATSRTH